MNLTDNAKKVFERRYSIQKDDGTLETPDEVIRRVVRAVVDGSEKRSPKYDSQTNMVKDMYFKMLYNMDFLPNSPTFTGAGTPLGQLAACFVLPIEDDMGTHPDGIFSTLKNAALIQQTGGGNGFSFSRLRPKGSRVSKSNGVATGPVGFLKVFDAAFGEIAQGGTRRGANMAVLRVDHPDIEEFIDCKLNEGELSNFNISVAATDEFMNRAVSDKEHDNFDLKFDGKVYKTVSARALLDKIAKNAHRNGEPGLIFIDEMNRTNPMGHIYDIEATNPCWTGDTKVWTVYGAIRFDELAKNYVQLPVYTQDDAGNLRIEMMRNPHMTAKSAKTVTILLDDGSRVQCTPKHRIYLKDGSLVEAQNLSAGDRVSSLYRYKANQKGYLRLTNGTDMPLEHRLIAEWKFGRTPDWPKEDVHHIDGDKQNNSPNNLEIMISAEHRSMHMMGESNPMSGVWDERNPLYDLNVSGKNNPRYRDDIDDDQLEAMRLSGMSDRKIAKQIGCSAYTVAKRLGYVRPESREAVANHKVVSVEFDDVESPVYNGTVDNTHRYFVMTGENDAILSRNCGEQALGPYENCCLGSINLANHITDDGKVDWTKLADTTYTATGFLDDVIDANKYVPGVPQVEEAAMKARRIGLGVMGWADMLFALGIRYGSLDSIELAGLVMEWIQYHATKASIYRAKDYGHYPAYNYSVKNTPSNRKSIGIEVCGKYDRSIVFWHSLDTPYADYGMRNATLTTVAPTGTISTVAGLEGYGMEPAFALAYTRYVKEADGDMELTYVSPALHNTLEASSLKGDQMKEVFDHIIKTGTLDDFDTSHFEKDAYQDFVKMRKTFVTSSDVSWQDHVKMQAAFQEYVDNSISKTINMPPTATVDDVKDAYVMAYMLACKGITVYVTGSREDVVLEVKKDETPVEETVQEEKQQVLAESTITNSGTHAEILSRPSALQGVTYRERTPVGQAYVTINSDDSGEPFEVFINVGKAGSEVSAISEAFGRIISLHLRSPSPLTRTQRLNMVAEEMINIGAGRPIGFGPNRVVSLPDGIARILRGHHPIHLLEYNDFYDYTMPDLPKETVVQTVQVTSTQQMGDICPDCGNSSFLNIEGCRKCASCGYSEC